MSETFNQIEFRNMRTADITAGLELCRASRWNQLRRDWELFLTLSPAGCRVAVKDAHVIGTVTTVSYQNKFSWIGMVLVDPAERRQGLGTKLLQEALNILHWQQSVGLDATPAGREVYLKLGFVDDCRLSRMETLVSAGIARGDQNPARRMVERDWQAVCELDQTVFGADRRTLLEWLFDAAPEYAWVICRDENLLGFTLGRHGFNFEQLGPVVAENREVARQLVSACLAEHVGKTFILDAMLPTLQADEWRQWLESIGFIEQRPFIRMFRGEVPVRQESKRQFAILGPEFG